MKIVRFLTYSLFLFSSAWCEIAQSQQQYQSPSSPPSQKSEIKPNGEISQDTILGPPVYFHGFAPHYRGKSITLYTYADYISFLEIPVATEQISDSGFFNFSFDTRSIKRLVMRCGQQKAFCYADPYKSYRVYLPARDTVRFSNPDMEETTDLQMGVQDSTDINALITKYNANFESFWANDYGYFVVKRSKLVLDSFELQSHALFNANDRGYFRDYMVYSLAVIKLNTSQGAKTLFNNYLKNRPIQYEHYEYMAFFNAFFNHYLYNYSTTKNGTIFKEHLNKVGSYKMCMEILAGEKYLHNDSLRELVLIKGLAELYYTPAFNRNNVLNVLTHLAEESPIEKHRLIAANVLKTFSNLKPTSTAPDFELADGQGKKHTLRAMKGSYVYLTFWRSTCTSCLQELKLISNLERKYGSKVKFVSINTGSDTLQQIAYLKKNPKLNWVFLHTSVNDKVKEAYEIKNYPAYFLVDPNGRFIQAPALTPAESIEQTFNRLMRSQLQPQH